MSGWSFIAAYHSSTIVPTLCCDLIKACGWSIELILRDVSNFSCARRLFAMFFCTSLRFIFQIWYRRSSMYTKSSRFSLNIRIICT
ncbi:hypothetical protein TL16_g09488 [Triparma laevis f. inornata]|uniref:Uncharacterized protein n=1 Tax=Triparma laevis f. inornata TaxID=1714386 RepID=A0A9W7B365_9STRA|nr:hypothetical protein TL16_g09488 [Triparma laevis f. inornata]